MEPSVEVRDLRKRFGTVQALSGASLSALPGEIHALLGENGAGKTTLLNVLDGMVAPDSGEIRVGGRPVAPRSPRDAVALGIGLVHQHFTLVPRLTVLENVALGIRSGPLGLGWPLDRVRQGLRSLAEDTGLEVAADAPVETLEVSARQRVEILKVLMRDPTILALDEPTAVLAPAEVERLFGMLRRLANGGRTILLIAHKLDEVLSVADRVTVLREGRTVLEAPRAAVDGPALARAMVGRELPAPDAPPASAPGPVVARLQGVSVPGERGIGGLRDVSLEFRRGEIVGIAGVDGNGQRALARVLAGRGSPESGQVELPARVGFVPGDRREEGLVLDFDLAGNVALALHDDPAWRRGPALRWRAIREETAGLIGRYGIRAPGPGTPVRALSGGNQQKVVVGRELDRDPDLLVVENPTRGLDVAAAGFVHAELRRRSRDRAVVLLSTDLDEILALSDRVLVMVRGACMEVPPREQTREGVGRRMLAGASAESP